MCLSQLRSIPGVNVGEHETGTGWKVFAYHTDNEYGTKGLFGTLQGNNMPRPINRWINENDFRGIDSPALIGVPDVIPSRPKSYPTGWHIYTSRSSVAHYFPTRSRKGKLYGGATVLLLDTTSGKIS